MREHLTNAAYGVIDYASYPVGMLLVAPIVLHKLGASEYGLWIIATSIVSAGGIIASGFGDAGIQRVARLRAGDNHEAITRTVRALLSIHLALALLIAVIVWIGSAYAASRIAILRLTSAREVLYSVRIAGGLVLLRAVESVGVGIHRAWEQYRITVQISAAMRLLTLLSAAILALLGRGVVDILLATGVFLGLGAWLQFRHLGGLIGSVPLYPAFERNEMRILLQPGTFVWLQTVSGVVFAQLDRIILGIALGALVVTPYALCVQFSQPIVGITASSLNFLFPLISRRVGSVSSGVIRNTLIKALLCNLLMVLVLGCPLLLFGAAVIRVWAGAAVEREAAKILPAIVIGSSLTALSVTGIYALQALGRFRAVSMLSIGSRGAVLLLMIELLRHQGLQGLALARVLYGAAALIVYLPLLHWAWTSGVKASASPVAIPQRVQEGR